MNPLLRDYTFHLVHLFTYFPASDMDGILDEDTVVPHVLVLTGGLRTAPYNLTGYYILVDQVRYDRPTYKKFLLTTGREIFSSAFGLTFCTSRQHGLQIL